MSRDPQENTNTDESASGGRPLSVLQIVTCRGWSSDAWAAVNLCLGLQEEGHRVLLLCRDVERGHAVAERARSEGVKEVGFIEASNYFHPASYFRDIGFLRGLVRERSLDAVHVHRGVEHWIAAAAWLIGDSPVVVRSRHIFSDVRRNAFNRWLYRFGADRTVAVCDKIRQAYLEGGAFPPDRFTTVMGGVDAAAYDPSSDGVSFRREWGIPPEAWVVGAAGSLRMWMKGQDVLLRAVARMSSGGADAPWALLIGKGEDMDKLKSLADELGIFDRTVITGYLENLSEALTACNALAFPSMRSEGTSRVLFDCLAAGRPVVASRVGCADEIVRDGREGMLVPPGDDAALAGALSTLRLDPGRAKAMGVSARLRAENEFDRRVVARETVKIYREAARNRRVVAA
jgi:glycosyltransferase involved in cell wall biosynthesis